VFETWEWNDARLAGRLTLADGQPDIWLVDLDAPFPSPAPAAALLSTEENQRAARYRFEIHRKRFIWRRAWLRLLLGRYLDLPPGEIELVANSYGKLSVAGRGEAGEAFASPLQRALRFNVSHSNGLALFAFALGGEVGVDIEYGQRDFGQPAGAQPEYESIAARFFSPAERAALLALPEWQRRQGFFNCWTRKEAYIKALGLGLSLALDAFDVNLAPGEPARLLAARHAGAGQATISLAHLDPSPDYVGALAVMGEFTRLNCRSIKN
jgi:4'-phosphopantetheinyl transferase